MLGAFSATLKRVVVLFSAASLAGLGASAQDAPKSAPPAPTAFTAISPIFSQLVMHSLPAAFVTVSENATATNYIREAVLKGETAERWTQMITVTGFKQLAANPQVTPQSFAGGIASGFKQACPASFISKGLGSTKVGTHDAFLAVASCGSVGAGAAAHSETALIFAVKGAADVYTLQWAERGAASATPLAIDDAKWGPRFAALGPIRLCPIVPGEKAPFPSCVNQK